MFKKQRDQGCYDQAKPSTSGHWNSQSFRQVENGFNTQPQVGKTAKKQSYIRPKGP